MEPVFTFAQRLEELKRMRGLTNSDLAKICGINKSNLTRYCNGEYRAKQDVIYRMAEKLGINEAWLMGYDVPLKKENQPVAELDDDRINLFKLITNLPKDQVKMLEAQIQVYLQNQEDQDV